MDLKKFIGDSHASGIQRFMPFFSFLETWFKISLYNNLRKEDWICLSCQRKLDIFIKPLVIESYFQQ